MVILYWANCTAGRNGRQVFGHKLPFLRTQFHQRNTYFLFVCLLHFCTNRAFSSIFWQKQSFFQLSLSKNIFPFFFCKSQFFCSCKNRFFQFFARTPLFYFFLQNPRSFQGFFFFAKPKLFPIFSCIIHFFFFYAKPELSPILQKHFFLLFLANPELVPILQFFFFFCAKPELFPIFCKKSLFFLHNQHFPNLFYKSNFLFCKKLSFFLFFFCSSIFFEKTKHFIFFWQEPSFFPPICIQNSFFQKTCVYSMTLKKLTYKPFSTKGTGSCGGGVKGFITLYKIQPKVISPLGKKKQKKPLQFFSFTPPTPFLPSQRKANFGYNLHLIYSHPSSTSSFWEKK